MAHGSSTAQLKYDMIDSWDIPTIGDGLHYFVLLCNYYNKFCLMFQGQVIPLRQLYIKYTKKRIPPGSWTPEILDIFKPLKSTITYSPVLARYNSSLPICLKKIALQQVWVSSLCNQQQTSNQYRHYMNWEQLEGFFLILALRDHACSLFCLGPENALK